jgi:hypothetical protein
MSKIGQTSAEKRASDSLVARQIVTEISKFGVSQPQLIKVLYYLSLEIENHEKMEDISTHINEHVEKIDSESKDLIV